MVVRVSTWNATLWRDVWSAETSKRYWNRPQLEQNAIVKQLACRREGLKQVSPFHSFGGGPGVKLSHHVCVLPRHAINTNRGNTCGGGTRERGGGGSGECGDGWLPWSHREIPEAPRLGSVSTWPIEPAMNAVDAEKIDITNRCDFVFQEALKINK